VATGNSVKKLPATHSGLTYLVAASLSILTLLTDDLDLLRSKVGLPRGDVGSREVLGRGEAHCDQEMGDLARSMVKVKTCKGGCFITGHLTSWGYAWDKKAIAQLKPSGAEAVTSFFNTDSQELPAGHFTIDHVSQAWLREVVFSIWD
jgi:hypothetical protein